jgi:hypothetical protein
MTGRLRMAAWLAIDLVLMGLLGWAGPDPLALGAALADPQGWVDQVGPDTAVVMTAGLLCWAMLLWVTVGLLLVASAAAPGAMGRIADAFAGCLVPAALRRAATVALGISVGTAAVASTAAAVSPPARTPHVSTPAVALTDDGQSHRPPSTPPPPADVDWPLDPAPAKPPLTRDGPSTTPSAGQTGQGGSRVLPPGRAGSSDASEPAGGPPTTGGYSPRRPRPATGVERPGKSSSAAAGAGPATSATPVAAPGGDGTASRSVVVQPGDCLWLIAARRLGPQPSAAEIAREWPRWYAVNRRVIGADPDLLRPGLALAAPPSALRSASPPIRSPR